MNLALFTRAWPSLHKAALAYAEAEIPVFPVNAREAPYVPRGFHAATCDRAQVDTWWRTFSGANIGLPTGLTTSLVIVDVDDLAALPVLRATYGAMPETFTVATPRGGLHYYFRHPSRGPIKCSQSKLCQHVDVRADLGYVLVPPSVIGRATYTVKADVAPAPLPATILEKVTTKNVSEGSEAISERSDLSNPSDHSEPSDLSNLSEPSDTPHSQSIEEILSQTLPLQPGERHSRILDLARGLKLNAGMDGCPVAELKPIIRRWHGMARPRMRTQAFDETWSDFLEAWKHARFPLSSDLVRVASNKAKAGDLPPEALAFDAAETRLLVGICFHLSRGHRSGHFFLSSHGVAKLLNRDQPVIYRRLQMLVAEGLLRLHRPGNSQKANRYQWLGSKELQDPITEAPSTTLRQGKEAHGPARRELGRAIHCRAHRRESRSGL